MRRDDSGAAMVEFLALAVIVLIPLAALVLAVFDIQRAAFGTTAAAREAARVAVRAPSTQAAQDRAVAATELTLADHDVRLQPGGLSIECSSTPCLTPGGTIEVTVRSTVSLDW